MDRKTAQAIANAAQQLIKDGPLAENYNVFVFDDGRVELDPVIGSWGAGQPANPDKYTDFYLDVPLAYLETVEDILDAL